MHNRHDLPQCLEGFEDINRYWDRNSGMATAKILPGEFYVTKTDEAITTVLGSCISACIRDVEFGIGGMNHFMLPLKSGQSAKEIYANPIADATRYGNFAMEHLINEILKAGGYRRNLEVKIFGGGKVLKQMTDIGQKNIDFVKDYIYQENLNLVAENVGGNFPRKILYFPSTGVARMKRLRSIHNDTLVRREVDYYENISHKKPDSGDVVLF